MQYSNLNLFLPLQYMILRFIVFFQIFCLLSVGLSSLFVWAGFEMNKNYITAELCINKNRPELHCNGRCYLMKKLKQAEEKEQKQEKENSKMQVQFPFSIRIFNFKRIIGGEIRHHIPFCTGLPGDRLNSIFHPPKDLC